MRFPPDRVGVQHDQRQPDRMIIAERVCDDVINANSARLSPAPQGDSSHFEQCDNDK